MPRSIINWLLTPLLSLDAIVSAAIVSVAGVELWWSCGVEGGREGSYRVVSSSASCEKDEVVFFVSCDELAKVCKM